MEIERKNIQLELKKDKEGSFTACIATLNVVDKDGDITVPGAFPKDAEVLVSSYQHGSWGGQLPVGKAILNEIKDREIAAGDFNMATVTGREHYESVKFTGNQQEWSYGFIPLKFDFGEIEGKQVRYLREVQPFEISPVLRGAGVGTTTLSIKAENTPYSEQAESVLAAVSNLLTRTKSLADLRRKEGRDLSNINKERIVELQKSIADIMADLKQISDSPKTVLNQEEVQKTYIKFLKLESEFMEVS